MSIVTQSEEIKKVIYTEHNDPFSVLGLHKVSLNGTDAFVIRSYMPNADNLYVLDEKNNSYKMNKVYNEGLFEVFIRDKTDFFKYKLQVTDKVKNTFVIHDPYSFPKIISDYDLHLFNEGNHHKAYNILGAHAMSVNNIAGIRFSVWAPCAKRVSVVGNFNQWDGRRHQMKVLGSSGVWEIFIPELKQGELYKYEIKTPNDEIYIKSDPYAFFSEKKPDTASVVFSLDGYKWKDKEWIDERDSSISHEKPMSIYEVHLGSWARDENNKSLTYRELADKLVKYVTKMNYTHIELMPIAEHPFDGSWGYQLTGYYSVTSRYGSPEDFMYFVDQCHQNNIGIILDWVPAHFPKDGHGLARFDGTALYEHFDKRQGEHPDWGTHIFNFSRCEVRNFLISNALFWFEKYHIDGLRVDAVASMLYLDYAKKEGEWVPNEWGGKENVDAINFMRQLNETVYKYYAGIMMVAEESTSWAMVSKPTYSGGLGFAYKWNMGWMNDFLRYISLDPIYKRYHQDDLTFSMVYAFSENFILVLSHDEVVHGKCSMISKMPGDYWQKFANLRACYGYMYGHPGKKLLFMGSEFGQFIEWDYQRSLDWHLLDYDMHKKMQLYVKDLNKLYKSHPAMYEIDFHHDGFEWIDCKDCDNSIFSFIRKGKDWRDMLIFVTNFTPIVHEHYRIGAPVDTFYEEILNSDSDIYGGSNVGNLGGVHAEKIPMHEKPYSIGIRIPPCATIVLKPRIKE
jgi:1,4-alpha-glucan branching enzyme